MYRVKYFFVFLFLLLFVFSFWQFFGLWDEQTFFVEDVIDGDTIVVSGGSFEPDLVRIYGIDAPEWGENNGPLDCFGEESTQWLSGKIKTQEVLLKTKGDRDIHGRLLAYVYWQNEDVGLEMIEEGFARHLRTFPHAAYNKYQQEEDFAKSQGKGLWALCKG